MTSSNKEQPTQLPKRPDYRDPQQRIIDAKNAKIAELEATIDAGKAMYSGAQTAVSILEKELQNERIAWVEQKNRGDELEQNLSKAETQISAANERMAHVVGLLEKELRVMRRALELCAECQADEDIQWWFNNCIEAARKEIKQ